MSTFIFAQNRYQLNIELTKLSVAASWLRSHGCIFKSNVKGAIATLTFTQMPKQVANAIAAKHGIVKQQQVKQVEQAKQTKQAKQVKQISREQYQAKFAHTRRNYPEVEQISREQYQAKFAHAHRNYPEVKQIFRKQYQTKFAHARYNYPEVEQISREQYQAKFAKRNPVESSEPNEPKTVKVQPDIPDATPTLKTVKVQPDIPDATPTLKVDHNKNNCDRRSGGSSNNLSQPKWKTVMRPLEHKAVTVHALKIFLFDQGIDEIEGNSLATWRKGRRTMIRKHIKKSLLLAKCAELGVTEIPFTVQA